MKVLIVEDSLGLVNVYEHLIENIINKITPEEDLQIISIVNYNEFIYFKNVDFDLVILDWNIIGGTSRQIIEEGYTNMKCVIFITGYANNKQVQMMSEKFSIPIISKPTTEFEISSMLEKAVVSIHSNLPYAIA